MEELAQIKATIPRALKRRFYAALALRDDKFTRWLCAHIDAWLAQQAEWVPRSPAPPPPGPSTPAPSEAGAP
jgi:hypothetical protein